MRKKRKLTPEARARHADLERRAAENLRRLDELVERGWAELEAKRAAARLGGARGEARGGAPGRDRPRPGLAATTARRVTPRRRAAFSPAAKAYPPQPSGGGCLPGVIDQ